MPSVEIITAQDAQDYILDYLGSTVGDFTPRTAKRVIVEALKELVSLKDWVFYYGLDRIVTVASYSTGTLAYDHTGGANERMLTLTSGTWPSWAARGVVVLSNIPYPVETRVSDSIITLGPNINPGADASYTTYEIYQEAYRLPINFKRMTSDLIEAGGKRLLSFVPNKMWLHNQRIVTSAGTPFEFAIRGNADYYGVSELVFSPPPSTAKNYDYLYIRNPRPVNVWSETTGTVSVTASGTSVTGVGTAFTSNHVGSVIRVGTGTTALTNRFGQTPPDQERIITAVTSTTAATVDSAWDTTRSGVAYVISDPIDIDPVAHGNLFYRTLDKKISGMRHTSDQEQVMSNWQNELYNALSADNRNSQAGLIGGTGKLDIVSMYLTLPGIGSNVDGTPA